MAYVRPLLTLFVQSLERLRTDPAIRLMDEQLHCSTSSIHARGRFRPRCVGCYVRYLPVLSARGSETNSDVRCAHCTINIGRVRMPSDDAWSVEVLRTVQANGNLLTRNKKPAVNKVRRASERRTAPRWPVGHSTLPDFLFWNCDSVSLWKNVDIFRLPAALYDLSRT